MLANPPFGAKNEQRYSRTFPSKLARRAYLFLQHFIKKLKSGGRCGVVIKNTFLSNTDNASVALRKQLLEECNLYAVLDLPGGAFLALASKRWCCFLRKANQRKRFGTTS